MTQTQETIEGNKIIEAFTGNDVDGNTVVYPSGYRHHISESEFHSNWNQLMRAVIEIMKIATVEISSRPYYKQCKIYNAQYNVEPVQGDDLILVTWTAVVDFLRWHQQKGEGK